MGGHLICSEHVSLISWTAMPKRSGIWLGAPRIQPQVKQKRAPVDETIHHYKYEGDVLWHPRKSSTVIRKRSASISIRPATAPSPKLAPARRSCGGSCLLGGPL